MASGPSTPISSYKSRHAFRPLNSSPLASPSPSRSSPSLSSLNSKAIPERRRLEFKTPTSSSLARSSTIPSSSSSTRHASSSRTRSIGSAGTSTPSSSRHVTHSPFNQPEDPQKQFLRERIKAKCLERAQKARARAVKNRRYTGYSDRSSDGFEMDDDEDEEENDDDIMGDELFRRIMAQTNRKINHNYRLSYALEVGSSFDPNLEDVAEWEHEVQAIPERNQDLLPADLDDEELEAYAEECARQAAYDEFADIPEEELFHLSDIDDILDDGPKAADEMDLS